MYALNKTGFLTAFLIPGLVIAGFYLGGWWLALPIVFSFVILPLIDARLGTDPSNLSPEEARVAESDFYYLFVLYVWTWFQMAFMCWAFHTVATGGIQTVSQWILFVTGMSLVTGGIGITVAHELGHKKSFTERLYSKILLLMVCYMHFYIEHNQGHHVWVATPNDPATARKNESFYAFWFRSVFGGYRHAWKIENERLRKKGMPVLSHHNRMIHYALLPLLFCAAAFVLYSWLLHRWAWQIPLFFFSQSLLAFTLLELVNYVEHYGIVRKEISPGRYERVNPLHSWNASHVVSNFFLFQLQRHSDHHVYAIKRYQVLNHYDESPQLPYGYPTMILIALVPPLWFALINRRLEAWQARIAA
ncbi:MAG: alkane 1-monooxygenase [Cyclobacteriaceae bacterium]|nr:MAG: alkane 1-monooxygenase [Cyclobacteriaceae bacterium]